MEYLLFDFQGLKAVRREPVTPLRGCSSAGRAPALQAGGQEFDSPHLHQRTHGFEHAGHGLIAQVVRVRA